MTRFILWLFIFFGLLACQKTSQNFEFDKSSDVVDIQQQLPGDWQRVCVFVPYTTNARAKEVLNFDYDVASKTSIATNDSINLLLTVRDNKVLGAYEVALNNVDFTQLGSRCYSAEDANFSIDQQGWPYAKHIK